MEFMLRDDLTSPPLPCEERAVWERGPGGEVKIILFIFKQCQNIA